MLFRKKSQPLLGLDITTSSVKLIELSQSGKRFRVESYAAEPTPPSSVNEKAIVDAKAVGEAIRRAMKRWEKRSLTRSRVRALRPVVLAKTLCRAISCWKTAPRRLSSGPMQPLS